LYIKSLNAFYLRKEADDSFILLNDNNYRDNNIELNLRYLLNDNIKDVKNEINNISPNIIRTNNIHTINKLKRRKLNKEMNPKMNQNLMNQNLINPNLINQNLMNQNLMNQNLMNQNLINPNLINPNLMNQNLMNQNLMNQNLINPNLINQNLMNQNLMNQKLMHQNLMNQKINIISPSKIPLYVSANEQKYNLTAHNSINIKCILAQHINKKTCTFPSIFDRTDTTPSNKINQIYHDNYYLDLNDKELDFIKKFCRNYTNIDVNYKSIDYYSQTNKIYNNLDNNYTLLDNLLIGTMLYILYFSTTGNFNGVFIFMVLSMFLITLNGIQNSLKNR
jgi:uncharacterized protein YjbI with pentapeptide repeats